MKPGVSLLFHLREGGKHPFSEMPFAFRARKDEKCPQSTAQSRTEYKVVNRVIPNYECLSGLASYTADHSQNLNIQEPDVFILEGKVCRTNESTVILKTSMF